ncbi:MAG: Grx4 family monothiol glutaredoxin [Bdellovibrionales bacterium]|nr:Grx4 family monothiol glutaredoxin [Ramlibacter sp.]
MNIQEKIYAQVHANSVVLYMKGTPQFPQCGFSSATVQMLQACGLRDFAAVDVLADTEIRAGIKAYANWPTIPQLYVNGELVGGADIVRELYDLGELQALVNPPGAT